MSKTQRRRPPRPSNKQPAQPKPPKLDALAEINQHAAGLGVGNAEIYAAVPESAADPNFRHQTTTAPARTGLLPTMPLKVFLGRRISSVQKPAEVAQ